MINKTQDMNEMQTRMEQMARVIHNKVGKGMRLGIMFLGMIPATALGLVACDEHRDFPDTGMKVGHILCTDGKVMSYEDYSLSGKEAIAVVFHLNRDEAMAGNGYAVYLTLRRKPLRTASGLHKAHRLTWRLWTAMRIRLPCMKRRRRPRR